MAAYSLAIWALTWLVREGYAATVHPPSADVIVAIHPKANELSRRAAQILAEEIQQRSGLQVERSTEIRAKAAPIQVAVGLREEMEELLPGLQLVEAVRRGNRPAAEGYALQVLNRGGSKVVVVAGNDGLGTLFGVGRLLRECRLHKGSFEVPARLRLSTAPATSLRGIQLGYREINNTCDVWDLIQFERYIRELIFWGCNAIELTPPVPPPAPDAAPDDQRRREWEMNLELSRLVHSLGLQVWLWVPVSEADARDPEQRAQILENRRRLFREMPHIDHLFVPGGDPGNTPVDILMPLLADMAVVLHEYHPGAGVWVSHQGFEPPERDRFYELIASERPKWLTGVVYGPWTRDSIAHTREAVGRAYGVRHYPDITHTCRCQYPVPEWDHAFALVEGREVCCPRPRQMAVIYRHTAPHCDGFVAYSDGVHDDVNKILWLALGWDPLRDVRKCLREYGRLLMGSEVEEMVAEGLLGLEQNWEGAIKSNRSIPRTRQLWARIYEQKPDNWRVQLHHFRAECDYYVQLKAAEDAEQEERARAALREAPRIGVDAAIAKARAIFNEPPSATLQRLREELWSLARKLRDSIGIQLSVQLGGRQERGNVVDFLNEPLNDRGWMLAELDKVRDGSEAEEMAAINRILSWEDPGPGGFYDDLGNPTREPHLVRSVRWEEDPGFLKHALDDFSFLNYAGWGRLAWRRQATTFYEEPLRMRYRGLDPRARYKLRVVYAGRFRATMELTANQKWQVHGPLKPPDPPQVLEFDIPQEATAGGVLELEWRRHQFEGRGPQVAEVWLVKEK
ncbi:MAG: hypothetical protein H5T86_00110 [Armatimonadetes bacterium]|nr:hypothetical protein [Armatimonadota bacterium]